MRLRYDRGGQKIGTGRGSGLVDHYQQETIDTARKVAGALRLRFRRHRSIVESSRLQPRLAGARRSCPSLGADHAKSQTKCTTNLL